MDKILKIWEPGYADEECGFYIKIHTESELKLLRLLKDLDLLYYSTESEQTVYDTNDYIDD